MSTLSDSLLTLPITKSLLYIKKDILYAIQYINVIKETYNITQQSNNLITF